MIAPSSTRAFGLGRPFPFKPFLSISGARSLLPGFSEDNIINAVEEHLIEAAFNISIGDYDRRREIRILPAALENFRVTRGKTLLNWDWQRITVEILSGYKLDWISGKDTWLLLNTSTTTVSGLLCRNQLSVAPGSSCRSGPKGSPRIMVDSLLRFLRKRRVA